MGSIDISIAVFYFAAVLFIGFYHSRNCSTASQLYLGGKEISWFPLGISVMISAFSAVNFIAFPTEIISKGPAVLISLPIFLLILIPIRKIFIPFFRSQPHASAYGFLGSTFSPAVKHLATILFILWRMLWVSVTLYASAKMVSAVTGLPLIAVLSISGLTALLYSTIGGFRAVVYTDLLQFTVLFGTIITALLLAQSHSAISTSSLSQWFQEHPFPEDFFSLNPRVRISFFSGLIGTAVAFAARYGADQITIQRYMAARSEKDAHKAATLNATAAFTILILLFLFSIAISLISGSSGKDHLPPIKQIALAIGSMPSGVMGLFTAALLAATMSSVDSGLNAMCYSLSDEFPVLNKPLLGKLLTVGIGVITIAGGIILIPIIKNNGGLFVVTNKLILGFGSPLLVLVLLGIYPKRITPQGALWGTIIGAVSSILTVVYIEKLAIHYYAVMNFLITVLAVYFISLFTYEEKREQ